MCGQYHYLRNALFVRDRMGPEGAARHIPKYANALMQRYDAQMAELVAPPPVEPVLNVGVLDVGAKLRAWIKRQAVQRRP